MANKEETKFEPDMFTISVKPKPFGGFAYVMATPDCCYQSGERSDIAGIAEVLERGMREFAWYQARRREDAAKEAAK
jgi:hypothetical protein